MKAKTVSTRGGGGKKKKTGKKKAPTRKKPTTKKSPYQGTDLADPYAAELKAGIILLNPVEGVQGCIMQTVMRNGTRCYKLRITSGGVGEAYVPVDDMAPWELMGEPESGIIGKSGKGKKTGPKTRKKPAKDEGGYSRTATERMEALVKSHDEAEAELEPAKTKKAKAKALHEAAEKRTFELIHESKNSTLSKAAAKELTKLEATRSKEQTNFDRWSAQVTQLKDTCKANVEAVFEVIRDARDGTGLFDQR